MKRIYNRYLSLPLRHLKNGGRQPFVREVRDLSRPFFKRRMAEVQGNVQKRLRKKVIKGHENILQPIEISIVRDLCVNSSKRKCRNA
jgi:translation elongation factor EF-Tu-like GTPase